jgi:hypothetical protein
VDFPRSPVARSIFFLLGLERRNMDEFAEIFFFIYKLFVHQHPDFHRVAARLTTVSKIRRRRTGTDKILLQPH